MQYLILAILCSSSIAMIFKISEGNNLNRYVVTSSNYFIAFTISLIIAISKGLFRSYKGIFLVMGNEMKGVFLNGQTFTSNAMFAWAMISGLIAGVFFFLSFLYYQKSVKSSGAALSGTFSKLGILVPMVFSIFLWGEIPTVLQGIGIILSLGSIVAINLSKESIGTSNLRGSLVLLFFFGGIAEFSNKIFQQYGDSYYKDLFLFFVFLSAFIISFIFILIKNRRVSIKDIFTGFLVGIPNMFSSFFLILSLNYLNTSTAFTIYSTGSMLCINACSCLFFNERLSRRELFCTVVIFLSIILMSV